jgi:HlyD family secretion protein
MVLHILKREGEGISPDRGLIELGDVRHMEAVAEVFETNARFVKPGQAAEFRSPALAAPIAGRVLRVLPKVERARLYSTDAAENTEARVIDVIIALDDDPAVRRLTGLQGTAVIRVSSGA